MRLAKPTSDLARAHTPGFTLLELMVVLGIIGVLAAIAVPLYSKTQERARIAKAQADTRAIAAALTQYIALCGNFPSGGYWDNTCDGPKGMAALHSISWNRATSPPSQVGPFFAPPGPQPPAGWRNYGYNIEPSNTFYVWTRAYNGDNQGRWVIAR